MKRMKFRLYTVLLCVVIFILTVVALIIVRVGTPYIVFWSALVYMVIPFFIYAFLVKPLMDKLSGKKILLLTFSVMVMAIAFTHSVWTITTPKWSFSVTTDKSTYRLGEDVIITVSLKKLGFITHSFKSLLSDPVLVSIEFQPTKNPTITYQVWYSAFHRNITAFSIGPNESLERNFIWNQTNIHSPEREIEPGIYQIEAFVPSVESTISLRSKALFWAWTSINITSSE